MKLLVTGASGFLGCHVVTALLDRGHIVRALIRPAAELALAHDRLETFRADLRGETDLAPAFENIDAVVHLAAAMSGTDQERFAGTVATTERLLEAMAGSGARRLLLAGSMSVYDWRAVNRSLSEESQLEASPDQRDAYTLAKLYQERVVRRASANRGWDLTVLRPGWIWGRPDEYPPRIGRTVGKTHLVFGPRAVLPLTHVLNCADCFAAAVESPRTVGQTLNVLDDYDVTAWRFMREYLRRTGSSSQMLPVPYVAVRAVFEGAYAASSRIFDREAKLSRFLSPRRFEANYRPLRYSRDRLRAVLGWRSRIGFEQCLDRTYGPLTRPPSSETSMSDASLVSSARRL